MMRRSSCGSATVVGLSAVLLLGCNRNPGAAAEEGGVPGTTVSPETVVVTDSTVLQTGPVVSGSLAPAREAQVRAEVAGTILETFVEPGVRVKRGRLIGRIDERAVRDSYVSARASVRSAEQALQVARRNAERSKRPSRPRQAPKPRLRTPRRGSPRRRSSSPIPRCARRSMAS
jgi:multidrug efflux pump subunit AcrA (membrane-fusion protein)